MKLLRRSFEFFRSPSAIPVLAGVCAVLSFVLNLPTLTVQEGLTPGDVGANLYIFEAINRGEVPYRDIFWAYGPLMLYYNALFFKLFGSQIQTAIWARIVLEAVFAAVFFLGARRIMSPWAALIAAVAFEVFTPNFQHNFSHYGGVCMEVGLLWAVLSYAQTARKKYVLWGTFFVLLLGFIKINFGIVLLAGGMACFVLCDLVQRRGLPLKTCGRYAVLSVGTLAAWAGGHYLFLRGLSPHEINQCFPIFGSYLYFGGTFSLGVTNFFGRIIQNIQNNPFDAWLAALTALAVFRLLFHMTWEHSCVVKKERNVLLIGGLLLLLMGLSYHEYFKGGLDYQAYWAQPFTIMLLAYLAGEACVVSGIALEALAALGLAGLVASQAFHNWKYLEQFKRPEHYFDFKHMGIYVTNAPKDIQSLLETARYIDQHIPKESDFFAFTSDGLNYYLTGRRLPYRLTQMIYAMRVTPEQEWDLIRALERKKVEYLVMGAGTYQGGGMMGVMGGDYGFVFDKYVKKCYREVARFGEWQTDGAEVVYQGGMGSRIFRKDAEACPQSLSPADLE